MIFDQSNFCKDGQYCYVLVTDCWFNHKDLGQLLEILKKIGQVKLDLLVFGCWHPLKNLEDIYEISRDKGSSFSIHRNLKLCRDDISFPA